MYLRNGGPELGLVEPAMARDSIGFLTCHGAFPLAVSLLSRFAHVRRLVTLRQTFVRRRHGGKLAHRGVNDEQGNLFSPEF
jgi:hypothetical protein